MSLYPEIENIQIVKDLKGSTFRKKIKELWEHAECKIHPFQKGDSHQASQHCKNVILNLNELIQIKRLNKLEKYLLCCAAILHDIDKAVIDYEAEVKAKKLHGVKSADYIIDNKDRVAFKFSRPEADAIAFIVRYHGDKGLNTKQKYPNKNIEDPPSYAKYRKIRIDMLAALFRLADMMDLTYKRISEDIVNLNFPNGIDNPKVIARQTFDKIKIERPYIILHTHYIRKFKEFQYVLIAIDMMNRELEEKGAKYYLKYYQLPYIFKLNEKNVLDDLQNLIAEREKISKFNEEQKLIINNIGEGLLKDIYTENRSKFIFSEGELKQLNKKCRYIFYDKNKKPITEIRNNMKATFAYSIDQVVITRIYDDTGGRIDSTIEYLNIIKPKDLGLTIVHDLIEQGSKAKFIKKYCEVDKYAFNKQGILVCQSANLCRAIWPDFMGLDHVKKIVAKFQSRNAWAMWKNQLPKMYPKQPGDHESFDVNLRYPICSIKIVLIFPSLYNIKPKCFYNFLGQSYPLEVNKDPNTTQTIYTISNLHIYDFTPKDYPEYQIKWTVPCKK